MKLKYFFAILLVLGLGLGGARVWQGQQKSLFDGAGPVVDITEDLHHRMLAGVLDLKKEPVVCSVSRVNKSGTRLMDVPNAYMKFSWELGSFWVKSNQEGLVVTHWNADVIYGHVSVVSSAQGIGLRRHFLPYPTHPVKIGEHGNH